MTKLNDTNSLKDFLKQNNNVFAGETATGDKVIIFVYDAAHVVPAVLSKVGKTNILYLRKEDEDYSSDLKLVAGLIYDVKPAVDTDNFPVSVEIVKDNNELLYSLGYRVIESKQLDTLITSLGFISSFTYTEPPKTVVVTTARKHLPHGYEFYTQETIADSVKLDADKYSKFVLDGKVKSAIAKMESGRNVMLWGPAGTGKTEGILAYCFQNEIPVSVVSHSAGMLVTDYTGIYRPNLEPGKINLTKLLKAIAKLAESLYNKIKSKSPEDLLVFDPEEGTVEISLAQFTFVLSSFAIKYIFGGVYLADELNAAPASVIIWLNNALESGFISLPTGIYYMHKDFRFVATGNPGYPGTSILSPATKGRLSFVSVPALTVEQMSERLINTIPDVSPGFIKTLCETIDKMNNIIKGENSSHFITIRHAQDFIDSVIDSNITDKKQAFFDAFFSETMDEDSDTFTDPSSTVYKTMDKYADEIISLLNTKSSKSSVGSFRLPVTSTGSIEINDDGTFTF